MDLFKRRDIVVPLKQRYGWAASFNGACVQVPYRIENRMIVSVECVFLKLRVSGDMNRPCSFPR
jgi:hypothetical protein